MVEVAKGASREEGEGGGDDKGGRMGTNYKLLSVPPMFWITSQRMIVSPPATCTEAFDFPANSLTFRTVLLYEGHPVGRGPGGFFSLLRPR